MAEIASAIGNGASSAVGDDIALAHIKKRSLINLEDNFEPAEVDVGRRERPKVTKLDMGNTQSWRTANQAPKALSAPGPSLSFASLELANTAKEVMGSVARNIMEGGVGMFDVLMKNQLKLQTVQQNTTPGVSDEAKTTTCQVC